MSSTRTTQRPATSRRSSPGATFWVLSALGVVMAVASWLWFGMAFEEEMSDQPKALSAGTTMAGFGFQFGTVPLLVAHAIGVLTLGLTVFPRQPRTGRGWRYAMVSVAVASLIGMVAAQVLFGGRLFLMGAGAADVFVP
ncbi:MULTISPECIES: hypothetical protein [Microbacterium]|uniref:hypothetical protein n=1 Tax=Microbacterium TaxID=33882 RepID=UPI00278972BD|nr:MULTISPECIES: hypothetical protein [Microbacterium]MDQ1075403.1 hypothetical protein [Microbacterium sp. SORGH_AS_0969]MDQ1115635.1 hypothetical protein [Microbacterium testaceum]